MLLEWPAPVEVSLPSQAPEPGSLWRMKKKHIAKHSQNAEERVILHLPPTHLCLPQGRSPTPALILAPGIRSADNGVHTRNPGDAIQATEVKV